MKLVKREDHWALYNEDGHKIAATLPGCNSKLSIKNCEAIANGYDLDELAKDYANGKSSSDVFKNAHEKDFITGFQKALEILGDKKFSEEDVISMIEKSRETGLTAEYLILTKQQNEWDVFFNPDEKDSEGCLILKRL